MSQAGKADHFRELHRPGNPLVLVNAWDAWSAKVVADAGFPALATSSHALAVATGYEDGQRIRVEEMAWIVSRIVAVCEQPLTVDFEAGFGDDAATVRDAVAKIVAAGGIGINLEDGQRAGRRELVDPELHQAKIAAARQAGDAHGIHLFINARVDTFILDRSPSEATVEETLRRARAYRDAGADGIFVPRLVQREWIARVAEETGLPFNVMLSPNAPPIAELAALGVARVSQAIWPFEFVRASLRAAVERFARDLDHRVFAPPGQ